jgi:hypothetical protein
MSPRMRPEKGHLDLEVKVANEIARDHVWNKLHPTTISVTSSKWYTRKTPFVLMVHPLDSSPLSLCQFT